MKRLKPGFTLLEVLVTIVIISIGIIAITRSFNKGLEACTDIENVDLALNIAQAAMEEIKNSVFDDIVDKGSAPDSNFPGFSVARDVTDKSKTLKQVDVTVAWAVTGGSTGVTLTTLVSE